MESSDDPALDDGAVAIQLANRDTAAHCLPFGIHVRMSDGVRRVVTPV